MYSWIWTEDKKKKNRLQPVYYHIQKQPFVDVLQNRCFKNIQNSQENTCAGVYFLTKLETGSLQLY